MNRRVCRVCATSVLRLGLILLTLLSSSCSSARAHQRHLPQRLSTKFGPPPGASGPLAAITTTSTGDSAVDFEFRAIQVLTGTTHDVMFRLVDNDTAPTTESPSPA